MKRMTVDDKKEALQNGLVTYKFPKGYFVKPSEADGKKFAIASKGVHGTLNIHSRFMTYDEFNCYLFGYYDAKVKKFHSLKYTIQP